MAYLYAVRMLIPRYESQPIKIGFSSNPYVRFKHYSCYPFPCELLGMWAAPNGTADEMLAHTLLKDDRLNGEWFRPSERVLEFLRSNGIGGDQSQDDLQSLIAQLEARWPTTEFGNKTLLKIDPAVAIVGLPKKVFKTHIPPVRLGRKCLYAWDIVKQFVEANPGLVVHTATP